VSSAPPALPPPAEGIEVADFDDEIVALVPERRSVVLLDTPTALVFDSCRRGHSLEALVDELRGAVGEDRELVRSWVESALVELTRQGILLSPAT